MSKQVRIKISDQEAKLVKEIGGFWGRTGADVIVEAFRKGLSEVLATYKAARGIEKPLSADPDYEDQSEEIE
jgi:hypothetical protein